MKLRHTSSKPSKQRRLLASLAIHQRGKLLSAGLSEELRKKHERRSYPIRTGDTVRITRGDFQGIEGKVSEVDRETGRIFVEGVTREKVSGKTVKVPIHASKVMITTLNLDDKWRAEALKAVKETHEAVG